MPGEVQNLFNIYQKRYPLYTREAIVDLMLKNGAISPDTAKKIKSGMSLFLIDNSVANINQEYKEELPNMDAFEFATQKKHDCVKRYHPKFELLEVDNNGNVNMEQFSLETIKKKYTDKKYKIVTSVDGFKVINKQNDQKVFESYFFDFDGIKTYFIHINDDNGNPINAGQIQNNKILWWKKFNKKGESLYSEHYHRAPNSPSGHDEKTVTETNSFGTTTGITYDLTTKKITERTITNKDGSSRYADYSDGIIEREWYRDKDYNTIKTVEYWGGKPFVEMDKDYNTTRYFLVEDLASKINSKNMLRQKSTPKSLITDIKTRIDKGNASQLWNDYYEQTGHDLFDDIDKTTLSNKEKEDLKKYLANSLANMTQLPYTDNITKVLQHDIKGIGTGSNLKYHIQAFFNNKNELHLNQISDIIGAYSKLTGNDLADDIMSEYGLGNARYNLALKVDKTFCDKTNWDLSYDVVCKYLADKISKDISGPGSGNLIHHVMMLNKNNVIGVLKHYTRPQILGVDVTKVLKIFKIDKDDYEDWATMEPLICAIYNESGLDNKTKTKLVNHIIKCIGNCHSSKYTFMNVEAQYSDIAQDLNTNKNDSDKVKIDAKRLDNRIESSYDNIMQLDEPSYPNGEIDESFVQNTTGDCWLLAGIISSIRKPLGKKMLEDLLTVDDEKRQVTVNLKGVNEKYVISFDEIEASNHLALGDGDIRAIEIAIDRYLKKEAYIGNEEFANYNIVDINGNWCKTVFNALFGNAERTNLNNLTKEDINSPNRAYTISFNRTKIESHIYPNAAYDEKGKPMDIIRQHAYGVIKADDKYVWLLNPWNPSLKKPIRITWEKLKELDITIEYTQFNQTKKS